VSAVVGITHNDVFRFIRVDVLETGLNLLVFNLAGYVGLVFGADLSLLGSSLAQYVSTSRMWKLTVGISTPIRGRIVRTFEDMALVTILVCTITETRKCTTDRGGRRGVDVRIAACIIRAVAAKEMKACRNTLDGDVVTEITVVASVALVLEEGRTDGNFFGIVCEVTVLAEWTVTYRICQHCFWPWAVSQAEASVEFVVRKLAGGGRGGRVPCLVKFSHCAFALGRLVLA
jgi:hypothetical protein